MFSKKLLYTSIFFVSLSSASFSAVKKDLLDTLDYDISTHSTKTENIKIPHAGKFQKAFDKSDLTNVIKYQYNKYDTYKVNLRTSMSTIISLPANEKITFFTLGDNKTFEANHDKQIPNILRVKSLYSGFDTNLIIKTDSSSIYNFYLRSEDENSKTIPNFTVYIDKTDNSQAVLDNLKQNNTNIKTILTLSDLNTSYKIKGAKDIAPIYVYDDGKWTYFDFGKTFVSDRLPTVYKVIDKSDSVINNSISGNVIIAKSLSTQGWILKNGDKHVCVKPKKSLYKIYKDERYIN